MIVSELVKIKFLNDNIQIEKALNKLGIEPLRWSVVSVSDEELTVSVSFIK